MPQIEWERQTVLLFQLGLVHLVSHQAFKQGRQNIKSSHREATSKNGKWGLCSGLCQGQGALR